MNPPFLATISILILALCPLHVISILPPPHQQRPQQKPTLPKPGGRKSPPLKGHPSPPSKGYHQDKALPPPNAPHKQVHALPVPHGQGNHLVQRPPLAGFKPGKPPPHSKANPGKKVGMLFLGFAGSLQVAIVGFLGFRRWQISKINDGEFAL